VHYGSGFWGGKRPSLAHYVTGMGPMDGATAAGGRSCCLSSDRKWSAAVECFLAAAGVRVIRTPFQAPNCNAHAERFVRSIREECFNHVIPLGERHLRRTLADFVSHYHGERNHQGLGTS
jgi:transposase InsO family protein